jgi:RNA polymerase-interacting CarD/CdnL/TRCF family regulator
MATTIQISEELKKELSKRKFSDRETYESIIWGLLEDTTELSKETKKELKEAREEIKSGKIYSLEQIKEELKIK